MTEITPEEATAALIKSLKEKAEQEVIKYYDILWRIEDPGAASPEFVEAVQYIMRRLGPPKA